MLVCKIWPDYSQIREKTLPKTTTQSLWTNTTSSIQIMMLDSPPLHVWQHLVTHEGKSATQCPICAVLSDNAGLSHHKCLGTNCSVNWVQSIVLLSILCMRCIWCVSPYLLPISIYNIPWCHTERKFSNFNTHIYLWFCMTSWAEDGHTATVYLYPRDIGKKRCCHQKCCGCMGYTVV